MKQTSHWQQLRTQCSDIAVFPTEVLHWIEKENLWNIWVPKAYGGLELPLSEGLLKLKELARIDGSLGWTVTLCSGANYFIGNLPENAAREIFLHSGTSICMGGSGGVFGTAEKRGTDYLISGKWRYATGAPYLTHFTLNAEIMEHGEILRNKDGSPKVRSFVVPKEEVQLIEDWDCMGLKATATHSFEVKEVIVPQQFSFLYNQFYLPQAIFKIPFRVFADLTLWANYIGMAEHFVEESLEIIAKEKLGDLENHLAISSQKLFHYAETTEKEILEAPNFTSDYLEDLHREASHSVKQLTRHLIEVYPYLGVQASRKRHPVNQVFCDYFTATQHYIFTRK